MGDFNLWLWRVIPQLREKGLVINLFAWFLWKTREKGGAMRDSCGIFSYKHVPYTIKLDEGMDTFNATPTGFFSTVLASTTTSKKRLALGNLFQSTSRRKKNSIRRSPNPSLSSPKPAVAEDSGNKIPSRSQTLNFQERRLGSDLWLVDDVNYKGSHFPHPLLHRRI